MEFRKTAAERILSAADRLFYAQGIRAVGVDTVAAEAGVSKRTLYNHYPSKDALIAAYLTARFKHIPPSDEPALLLELHGDGGGRVARVAQLGRRHRRAVQGAAPA